MRSRLGAAVGFAVLSVELRPFSPCVTFAHLQVREDAEGAKGLSIRVLQCNNELVHGQTPRLLATKH